MIRRATFAPLIGASLLLAGGCAARHPAAVGPANAGDTIGVYRGQVWDGAGRRTKFRLLLYARLPDHIHAELIAPVGGTAWILDAGNGRVSLTVVAEAAAYVGPADARTVARLLGIAVAPSGLVRALLAGEPPGGGVSVVREPAAVPRLPGAPIPPAATGEPAISSPSLPDTFELRDGARGFRLERSDTRPAVTRGLATGIPPAGLRQVPLDEFDIAPAYD